jgi:hypothetical protein
MQKSSQAFVETKRTLVFLLCLASCFWVHFFLTSSHLHHSCCKKTFGWIASLLLVDYPSLPLLLNITGGHHNHSFDDIDAHPSSAKNNLPREARLQYYPSIMTTSNPHMMDSNPQTSSEQLEKVRWK